VGAATGSDKSCRRARAADQRLHGIAAFLAHSGMDQDAALLDRLAARAERVARCERCRES
jgi:hypothetical protein